MTAVEKPAPKFAPGTARKTALPDRDLRGYFETNSDWLHRIAKPVRLDEMGALSAQSDRPILYENIIECPGFRAADILVKNRESQARALGVARDDYLKTLAFRLRQPPRGLTQVGTGPVKEVVITGDQIDWRKLPVYFHSEHDDARIVTAMAAVKDPETGFYNTSHPRTMVTGARRGVGSFVTPHTNAVMRKYRAMGKKEMPIVYMIGIPPAYEIMGNFSGLHMDMWGELEMVGTIMQQDIEMVPGETVDMMVPAHAEIVVEGMVQLDTVAKDGQSPGPSMYYIPRYQQQPELEITAITMRADRPIMRNHQSCAETDHQTLPRLCHEAVLYNRLTEMGLKVKDVRFPTWGGGISCILQFEYPRPGFVNDALMAAMGAPWLNTKVVLAVSPDTDIDDAGAVWHAMVSRCDPAKDVIQVGNTRGSAYDPSAEPLDGHYPWRVVGKMGIDATIKDRYDATDFERGWPKHWGKIDLGDFIG